MKQWHVYMIAMSIIFIASRAYFFNLEILTDPIYSHWQILDIEELRNNLFQSLYYQHSQPPFFNLLIALLAKVSPSGFPYILAGLYLVMSLGIYWMIFQILIYFNIHHIVAFLAATLYILTPEAILYERWLFYTWFIVFLLILSVYLLMKYVEKKYSLYLLGFFIVVTIVMLTRSLFHLIYLPGVMLILYWLDKKSLRRIALMSLIPLLSVLAVYMKNYVEFGFFGASSWLGMNISRVATHSLLEHSLSELSSMDYAQKEKEIRQNLQEMYVSGEISEVSIVGGFKPISEYPAKFQNSLPSKYSQIKVLSKIKKSSGYTNLNHYGYLEISNEMKQDALRIIGSHLSGYSRTVVLAFKNYMKPSWDYPLIFSNVEKMNNYINIFELYYLGGKVNNHFGLVSLMMLPIILLVAILFTGISLFRQNTNVKFILLFLLYTISYVMLLGIILEIGELNRMRVMTDPLLFILCIVAMDHIFKGLLSYKKTMKVNNLATDLRE